mgnify:CR=1 FL=1
MTLSRTARILIAALLVAAAAFFWVNFFNQEPLPAPLVGQPSGVVTPLAGNQSGVGAVPGGLSQADAPDVAPAGAATVEGGVPVVTPDAAASTDPASPDAASSDAAVSTDPASADAAAPADGAVEAPAITVDGAAPIDAGQASADQGQPTVAVDTTPVVVDNAPPVIVTGAPTVVTRDLVVEDLPFLVTSPPSATAALADPAAAGADRPEVSQRSNINPFSPIVVQAPPSLPVQDFVAQDPPASEPVIDIVTDSNGQPVDAPTQAGAAPVTPRPNAAAGNQSPAAQQAAAQQPAAVVRAPAPRAVAPATSAVSNLPRPLPSGTLPTTPEILRDARTQTSTTTPTLPDVGTLAALRVPDENQPLELTTADGEIPTDGVVTPELIGPGRPATSEAAEGPAVPLAVGADLLSRYLRDNNVSFTGTVLGPLSVGVFRSNLYGSPVVLTLGQTLPDTDILLTDLRGYEARFSLGDRTQTLALDLRR